MIKTTVIHLTINSNGHEIGGELKFTTPADPAHQAILEAMTAAFAQALENQGAKPVDGVPDSTLGDRATLATRFKLLIQKNNRSGYNDAVLDCLQLLTK